MVAQRTRGGAATRRTVGPPRRTRAAVSEFSASTGASPTTDGLDRVAALWAAGLSNLPMEVRHWTVECLTALCPGREVTLDANLTSNLHCGLNVLPTLAGDFILKFRNEPQWGVDPNRIVLGGANLNKRFLTRTVAELAAFLSQTAEAARRRP